MFFYILSVCVCVCVQLAVDQVVGCVSLKVFEASDFTSHPLFSVGGVDLQQVSGGGGGRDYSCSEV